MRISPLSTVKLSAFTGIGKLLMDSISTRDYPLVQMIVVSISFLYLVLTQISDGIQNRTDTRIKGGELP